MLCKLTRIITKSSIIKRLPPKLELPAAAARRVILTNSIFNLLNEDPNQDRARKFIAALHLFPGSELEKVTKNFHNELIFVQFEGRYEYNAYIYFTKPKTVFAINLICYTWLPLQDFW